ncbi:MULTISPECIES: hypothetical protein [Xanthomonas]|jgi:hypothetical protein|uniref:hypothetical protein n=1 Tax=Xanthomonas TaxID=338 RepID=UPI00197EF44D|nr:hypothetical protein [Xanthomonas bonasiae]MBN6110812.1 hypothetical protein [Xanthomonas bonasiae]
MSRIGLAVVFMALLSARDVSAAGQGMQACEIDRPRLLALDQQQFDQDVRDGGGGWRAIAARPGCETAAADLIRDYRKAHPDDASLLYWHEGQLRAFAGDYPAAMALMQASKKPASQDPAGWNPYVDATMAFLAHDQKGLAAAKKALDAVPPSPDLPPLKDGVIELPMQDGQVIKMRWPPNADVVEGLARCMEKSYAVAYSQECRAGSP